MTKLRTVIAVMAAWVMAACVVIAPPLDRTADVIVIGDSILAWHRGSGQSIPDVMAEQANMSVTNQSIAGATFMGEDGIPSQFAQGAWDMVVLTGGGNDIGAVCGTDGEARVLAQLISADGTQGALPDFARSVRDGGSPVLIVGYYPISVQGGPFAPCQATLDALKARQGRLAAALDGVTFVDTGAVIPPTNLSLYDDDLVHPSVEGAARIGALLAQVLRQSVPQ